MASLLGAAKMTLADWERGDHGLEMPTRKLIWLLEGLFFDPARLATAQSIAWWGGPEYWKRRQLPVPPEAAPTPDPGPAPATPEKSQ